MRKNIITPDNPADITITLQISGNHLVSVCNALQQLLFETGRARFVGDDVVSDGGWGDLYETVERIRDQLSEQRCARR